MSLRGALLGFGNVAAHAHLPGWRGRPDVDLVAAMDARADRRAVCARLLPGARWYASAEALLGAEDLDFVDICTPPSSHAPLIRAALERGCHVLCEKPLVGSPAELAAVARAAAARRRVLYTVHNWHHAPIVRRADELIREGAIGRPTRVVWRTLRTQPAATAGGADDNWRVNPAIAGGGILTDHGWHVFYIVPRWLDATPTAVSATLESRGATPLAVEDTATVRLTFPRATAEVLLTWAAADRTNWAEISGELGTLRLEDDTLVLTGDGAHARWPCPPRMSDGSAHPDWFGSVVHDFIAAARGETSAAANLGEAALCVAVEAAARESSRRGGAEQPVRLPAESLA
ncbi:MAG: Gfo/Idh/MocA family protein [Candidatus Rokuibacteriota bacterium]